MDFNVNLINNNSNRELIFLYLVNYIQFYYFFPVARFFLLSNIIWMYTTTVRRDIFRAKVVYYNNQLCTFDLICTPSAYKVHTRLENTSFPYSSAKGSTLTMFPTLQIQIKAAIIRYISMV
jgi:hypothetical protein